MATMIDYLDVVQMYQTQKTLLSAVSMSPHPIAVAAARHDPPSLEEDTEEGGGRGGEEEENEEEDDDEEESQPSYSDIHAIASTS